MVLVINLLGDIGEQLAEECRFNPSSFDIKVRNGNVIIKGDVSSLIKKRMVERVIKTLKGVSSVTNQLTVRIPQNLTLSDSELERKITDILTSSTGIITAII